MQFEKEGPHLPLQRNVILAGVHGVIIPSTAWKSGLARVQTWRPFSELLIFPRTTREQELNPRPYAYCLSPRYLHPVVFKDGGFGRLKIVSLFACILAVSVEYFSFFLLKHLKIFLLIASGKFLYPLPRNLKRRLRAIRCLLTRNRSVEG